jgi:membrane fusion protein, multidrug efflux system
MSYRWAKFAVAGIALAILIVAPILYSRSLPDRTPPTALLDPIPVITTTVQQNDVPIVLTGLGTATALNAATIHS